MWKSMYNLKYYLYNLCERADMMILTENMSTITFNYEKNVNRACVTLIKPMAHVVS